MENWEDSFLMSAWSWCWQVRCRSAWLLQYMHRLHRLQILLNHNRWYPRAQTGQRQAWVSPHQQSVLKLPASSRQNPAAPILRTTRIRAKMAGLPKTLQIPGHRKPLLLRRHQEDRLLQQEPRLKLSSPSRPGPKPVRKSSRQNLDRRNQSLQNLCLLHCPEKHRVLSTVRMRWPLMMWLVHVKTSSKPQQHWTGILRMRIWSRSCRMPQTEWRQSRASCQVWRPLTARCQIRTKLMQPYRKLNSMYRMSGAALPDMTGSISLTLSANLKRM